MTDASLSDDELAVWATLDDHALATSVAAEAGRRLMSLRRELTGRGIGRMQLKDAGDMLGHTFIMGALRAVRPDDWLLSEEGSDSRARLAAARVWIIDPLDGTREFGEGRADWAVHIALWEGGDLVAGAVALPARELVLATEPAPTVPPSGRDRPLLITSRSSQPYSAMIVEESLRCDTVTLGSAGAKAMSVVLGEADIYVHDGGMNQWDSAAPVAVALAAGLHASRINGAPFSYNDADTYMPDLLICRPELADLVLDSLWGNRRPR